MSFQETFSSCCPSLYSILFFFDVECDMMTLLPHRRSTSFNNSALPAPKHLSAQMAISALRFLAGQGEILSIGREYLRDIKTSVQLDECTCRICSRQLHIVPLSLTQKKWNTCCCWACIQNQALSFASPNRSHQITLSLCQLSANV